jgi:hypothetical protein
MAPHMLAQPTDAAAPLPLLADGDAIRQLLAALSSLAARDESRSLPVRVRSWVSRVTGRRNRYVLEAVVRATGEIADRCDEVTTRLMAQEGLTSDVARTFGEELALLRAEVIHLRSMIDSSRGTTGSAN